MAGVRGFVDVPAPLSPHFEQMRLKRGNVTILPHIKGNDAMFFNAVLSVREGNADLVGVHCCKQKFMALGEGVVPEKTLMRW